VEVLDPRRCCGAALPHRSDGCDCTPSAEDRVGLFDGGFARGVSLTLVTGAANPKRIEKGAAAAGSQFAMSGGAVQCPKEKKGEGFHEVPFAVFGFPGATLKLVKGVYGFSKTTKEKTSALGGTGSSFTLKVKIVGTVTSPTLISGTVQATGGPCTMKKPVGFSAKLDPELPVAPRIGSTPAPNLRR
jgi:hypothetical protein